MSINGLLPNGLPCLSFLHLLLHSPERERERGRPDGTNTVKARLFRVAEKPPPELDPDRALPSTKDVRGAAHHHLLCEYRND